MGLFNEGEKQCGTTEIISRELNYFVIQREVKSLMFYDVFRTLMTFYVYACLSGELYINFLCVFQANDLLCIRMSHWGIVYAKCLSGELRVNDFFFIIVATL